MFDGKPFRDELDRRLDAVRCIVNATHPTPPGAPDAGREIRGLAIVLLFASYENLLKSLCRQLLEVATSLRVGNRRLRKGFRLFAVHNLIQSATVVPKDKLWKSAGPRLLDSASETKSCSINTSLFPDDGSFMKSSQVILFCDIFELGDPGPILKEVWDRLDTIVKERNGIAHGGLTPEEVGRNYSFAEIQNLISLWQLRWTSFIDHIESRAQSRDFYRHDH